MTTASDLFVKWGKFSRTNDLWTFENVHSTLIPGSPFACRASAAEIADDHVTEGIRRGIAVDVRDKVLKYAKRHGNETQRAKPWHIIRPDSRKEDVLCGAYRSLYRTVLANPDSFYERWTVATFEIPEGQIICSVCERVQDRIPPFQKKEKQ